MKPLLLLPFALLLVSAAMLHSALVRESWPITIIYRYPVAPQDVRDAHPGVPSAGDDDDHPTSGGLPSAGEYADYEPEPEPEPQDPIPTFPLDLNRATREELMFIPGIGEVLSGRIVQYRDHLGGYTDVSQLTGIYGISQNTLERIGGYLTVN